MEQKLTDEQRKALAKARTEWPAEVRIHPEYSAAMFLAGAEYQRTLDAGICDTMKAAAEKFHPEAALLGAFTDSCDSIKRAIESQQMPEGQS